MIPIKDTIHSRTFPFVNWLIIIMNVLVFVLIELPLSQSQLDRFSLSFGLVPANLLSRPGTYWITIFTSMFLHGGWLHLIGNMWALFIFGDNVEDRMGSLRYLIFYLICGTAAGLTQVYLDPSSKLPMIGASGAIAGVLGAYLVLYPTARVLTLIPIVIIPWLVQIPAVIFLAIWFFLQFFSGYMSIGVPSAGGVAYWAHVGGFITGLILVWIFARRSRSYTAHYPDEYHPW